jgi:hypothetical protein
MVLVQFFEDNNISDLQNTVNGFLKSKTIINVIDIKYNQNYTPPDDGWHNPIWYSAMVIYSGYVEFDNNDSVPTTEETTRAGRELIGDL